jgi:hypothetical protein
MADSRLRGFSGWYAVCSLSLHTTSATVWPMFGLAKWTERLPVGLLLAWVVLMLAALVGTTMVAVGMIEELPGIVRNALSRSFKGRHP